MHHNDFLNRFLFDDTDIRGEIVALEKTYQEAYAHQQFPKSLRPLFGEFLSGAALLSEVLKFKGTLTLQARGDGDVSIVMAEVTDEGFIRGIVRTHPERDLPEDFDATGKRLPELLGNAILTITIDPLKGQRHQGIVPLAGDNLSDCLGDYFRQSEQLPTHINLFSEEKVCGGLFLQCLPAQLVKDAQQREDQWETVTQLAATASAEELFELDNEALLTRLFHEMTCRVFPPKRIHFRCTCDRDRSANALQSLGYEDAKALLEEQTVIIIDCQFCGKVYRFDGSDLGKIFPAAGEQSLH